MPVQRTVRHPRMKPGFLTLAALAAVCTFGNARAQVAEDGESAQRFLVQMLQQNVIHFTAGNNISEQRDYGLQATVPGRATSYSRKFMRGWSEHQSYGKPFELRFNAGGFGSLDGAGRYDPCVTSVGSFQAVSASNVDETFAFPHDGLEKEKVYGEDVKWIYRIEQDPQQFSGPLRIDWRKAGFDRTSRRIGGRTDFLVTTGERRVPYAQLSVFGADLGDYVENAIRVLQLSCRA